MVKGCKSQTEARELEFGAAVLRSAPEGHYLGWVVDLSQAPSCAPPPDGPCLTRDLKLALELPEVLCLTIPWPYTGSVDEPGGLSSSHRSHEFLAALPSS